MDRPFDVGVWCLILKFWIGYLARCGTPSVAGGLKAPEGGTAASHTLARPLGLYMHQLYAQMDALTDGDQGWDN